MRFRTYAVEGFDGLIHHPGHWIVSRVAVYLGAVVATTILFVITAAFFSLISDQVPKSIDPVIDQEVAPVPTRGEIGEGDGVPKSSPAPAGQSDDMVVARREDAETTFVRTTNAPEERRDVSEEAQSRLDAEQRRRELIEQAMLGTQHSRQTAREEAEKWRQAEEQRLTALKAGEDCDRIAGNPTDPRRNPSIPGAPYVLLRSQAEKAVEICKLATEQWPNELRYKYQLARARQAISRDAAYGEMLALANAGYPAAHDNLGWIIFQRGKGQYPRTKTYFEKGARLGDPDSMVSLSRLLVSGEVGPRDIDTAIFWLRKAAEMGHPDAQELLSRYEEEKDKGGTALGVFLNVLGNIIKK